MYNASFETTFRRKVAHGILIAFGTVCGGMSAWYSGSELIYAMRAQPSGEDRI